MKTYILLVTILMLLIAPGVEAVVYQNISLAEVISQLAEEHGEKVIFLDWPEEVVTVEIAEEDFTAALAQLLTDSSYRFTRQGSYYLIGTFGLDSAQFAARADSLIYRPRFIKAAELADKLKSPRLRLTLLSDSDTLFIQGLPEDLVAAERKIQALDQPEQLQQLRYQLTVIDLSTEARDYFHVRTAELSNEVSGEISLLAEEQGIEFYPASYLNRFNLNFRESREESLKVARPSLVTTPGERGSLTVSEETFAWSDPEAGWEEMNFQTVITPHQVASTEKRVKTGVEFRSGSTSELATVTWLDVGEEILLGYLNLDQTSKGMEIASRSGAKKSRLLAIYITVMPVENKEAASLNGLERLVLPEHQSETYSKPGHLQALIGTDLTLDLDFSRQYDGIKTSLDFASRQGTDFMRLGLGFSLFSGLELRGTLNFGSEIDTALGFGLTDRVNIAPDLELAAAYYPLMYDFSTGLVSSDQGWVELAYRPEPIFLEFRYSFGDEPAPLRIQTGYKLKDSTYVVGAISGGFTGINRYLLGLRLNN